MPDRRRRVALALVVFSVLFAQVLLYPGVDRLVGALGAAMDLNASMWFLAAEFAAFVLFAGLWGAASDRAGRRIPFIVVGALGGALGYATLAVLPRVVDPSFEVVLLLRALQGAATIGPFSLAMTGLMELDGGHGRNMGAAGIAIGSGTALGAPVGGQLYGLGPLVPLWVAAGALVVAAGLAARVGEVATADRDDDDEGSLGEILTGLRRTPALAVPYAFGFIDRLTAGFFALVGTLYFRSALGASPGMTGLLLGCFFVPFALLQFPFGILSDRVGRVAPIVAGSALYGIGVALVGVAPNVPAVAGAMLAVGVLGALMAPATMALVTDLSGVDRRGVAMAGFNVFGSIGFLVGIVGGGLAANVLGFGTAFLAAGGVEVLLAVLALPYLLRLDVDRQALFAR
ncbi:MFS transporter [Haloglomus irregulare]|uniref:MFS transporter n=1 Tax=Haloglomus irregulare TaxID=2234134 RepID=A0A554N9A2_9EURY|nr:MFS transporter [Haloglomus irregulare]TSD13988.1 MFS transporter [Haloglomus irregulare]